MYRVKHGAVIGKKTFFLVCARVNFQAMGWVLQANHSVVFDPVHQTTEFRQTTVLTTMVDPSDIMV